MWTEHNEVKLEQRTIFNVLTILKEWRETSSQKGFLCTFSNLKTSSQGIF